MKDAACGIDVDARADESGLLVFAVVMLISSMESVDAADPDAILAVRRISWTTFVVAEGAGRCAAILLSEANEWVDGTEPSLKETLRASTIDRVMLR